MARTLVRSPLLSKENIPLGTPRLDVTGGSLKRNKISAIREHWEHKVENDLDQSVTVCTHRARDSPILTQLKSHPGELEPKHGTLVSAVQRELARKHHAAKSRVDGVGGLGGGVSLWPAMDDMRLSRDDTKVLVCVCVVLVAATCGGFSSCHGAHITSLNSYSHQLRVFHSTHSLSGLLDQEVFEQQLLTWHKDFIGLQDKIHHDFDMKWNKSSIFEISFVFLYVGGVVTLLYLLVRNMFSKQHLTPRVIKAWISLLCVVTTWTVLSVYLLVCAQRVETATQGAVHQFNEELATLVQSSLDLTKYHSVLIYWQTRSLPPTTTGVLSIMGLLAVQDVSYYLQYYSLPILTAICTPIVKIVVSLRKVYSYH